MERTWFTQYDAGVPTRISYPNCTVPDLLQRAAAERRTRSHYSSTAPVFLTGNSMP